MPDEPTESAKSAKGTRPKPRERWVQMLAMILQQPGADRGPTAALTRQLDVSESSLYRRFASKAQMFEVLIVIFERSLFSLINQITMKESDGLRQLRATISMLRRQPGRRNVYRASPSSSPISDNMTIMKPGMGQASTR